MDKMTILKILIFLVLPITLSYKIEKIHKSSGLFFDNLGKTRISNQKFTLITYTNLTHIQEKVNMAFNIYYKSLHLCSRINSQYLQIDCTNQLFFLRNKLDDIQSDYDIISHQFHIKREKRGLINAGGNVLHWLFGTPDSDDAQYYADSINSLIYSQKQTHVLLQNQIGIISSTITTFNESARKLSEDAHFLNDNLDKFDKFITQTVTTEERLSFELQIIDYMLTLTEVTNSVHTSIKSYLNSVTLMRHGIIDFEVVRPQVLLDELDKIQTKFLLPLPPNLENTYIYYKLMKVKSFISRNLLVTSLDIPIVDTKSFNLYKIYPLPTPHANDPHLYSYIEPSQPFLIISSTKTSYSMLNRLDDCQEYLPTSWLCEDITIMKRTSKPNCETRLFFNATRQIPETCSIKNIYADIKIWHKVQPDQWLYILSSPTVLNILCREENDREVTISDLGLLQLPADCKAYADNIILEPQSMVGQANLTNNIPSLKLTNDDCCIKLKENISLEYIKLSPIKLHSLNLDELQFAQHKLREIDQTIQNQLNQPFIIKRSNWFTATLITISTSLLLYVMYKLFRFIGLFSLLSNLICPKQTSQPLAITDSKCTPCVQVFSNCFNKRKSPNPDVEFHYEAELERLNYPSTTKEHQSPQAPLRRSTRSRKSTISSNSDDLSPKVSRK